MKPSVSTNPLPKRPFNLTLTEGNVERARKHTHNLSATVDKLLEEFADREESAESQRRSLYAKVSEAWNTLDEKYGTFGSEFSPL